jgi:Cu/Ag efflux pump CusA
VRLGDVADVGTSPAATAIQRDAASRYVDIEADVDGRALGAVAGDVEESLANLKFPLEYHAEVRTESTSQEINLTRMAGFGLAAVIAIFLLLQAAFRSWRLAALAFLTLPVALLGGVLAAFIDGAALSLGSLIAFLALLGIAVRNGIMLIHRCQQLRADVTLIGFGIELVRRGSQDRLGPVLTTASALALLVLPFVIMGNVAGLEIVHPMAIVLLGGLVTTTFISLFVLPALYLRFGAGAQPDVEPQVEPTRRFVAAEADGNGKSERTPERQAAVVDREQAAGTASTPPTDEGGNGASSKRGSG